MGRSDLNPAGRGHRGYLAFLLAAGASVPVNLAARALASMVVSYGLAIVIAHLAGMLTAYALTRAFVFARSGRTTGGELLRFALVNLLSLAITWGVAMVLLQWLLPALGWRTQAELVAHVGGLAVSSVSSFFAHRGFTFARQAPRAMAGPR